MKEIIKHLLIPKEFRVYCRPNNPIQPQMVTTTKPGETGCVNCLNAFVLKTKGRKGRFTTRMAAASRKEPEGFEEWRTPVLPENL